MTSARKRGRPFTGPSPDSLSAVLRVRVHPDDLDRYRAAAYASGDAIAEVTREALDAWAERVLRASE